MKSLAEIRVPREDMAVHGKGYEINTLRSIRSVRSAMSVEFWFRWKRSTTNFLWVKAARMIGAIWLRCVSRVIRKYMRNVGIDGGRGYRNLYRPVSYRTAGGCCVCSREMEHGGIDFSKLSDIIEEQMKFSWKGNIWKVLILVDFFAELSII